jgi:Uma2 family endonuclease
LSASHFSKIALSGCQSYVLFMATLTIELPPHQTQTRFNLRRWAELLADAEWVKVEGRIETDRHGHVIMSPPPAPSHGSFQSEIAYLLRSLMHQGRVFTECPISTAEGVKAADVAWASPQCLRELGNRVCFPRAPEICVEVLSPSNTAAEIGEKTALYFEAGAKEVWVCALSGAMRFVARNSTRPVKNSKIFPAFPERVELP